MTDRELLARLDALLLDARVIASELHERHGANSLWQDRTWLLRDRVLGARAWSKALLKSVASRQEAET